MILHKRNVRNDKIFTIINIVFGFKVEMYEKLLLLFLRDLNVDNVITR